jgi:hypothetical protein
MNLIAAMALLIPILALLLPVVALLVKHQHDMAKIIHAQPLTNPDEIVALRQEVAELRQLMHQQAIALDSISRSTLGSRMAGEEVQAP